MKKILSLLAIGLLMLSACDIHSSDNGALDGYWQLASIDTLGGQSSDVREKRIFWAVQGNLLEMQNWSIEVPNAINPMLVYHFTLKNNQLTLSAPIMYDRTDNSSNDSVVTDVAVLRQYGLMHIATSFQVLQLSHSDMTLKTERQQLHFRKY